ncbi:MAG TPA: hypothetical protein VNU26_11825 [Mycobacteriales bacterium]|nr:hypothetical protein [Mycobacteriales bacterium]
MRKRTLGVALLAGLAVSGAGAFTAGNTVPSSTAGYGSATVTGATVTDIAYTLDATDTDSSKVTAVVFTANGDLSLKTAKMTLKNGGSDVTTATNTCAVTYLTNSTITCTFTAAQEIASFDGLALTVYDA